MKGLHNIGNSCFLNASLQCLACVPQFLSGLADLQDSPVADALRAVYDEPSVTSLQHFRKSVGGDFALMGQHDVQEFVCYLLDRLGLDSLVTGKLQNTISCAEGHSSSNTQPFTSVALPLPTDWEKVFIVLLDGMLYGVTVPRAGTLGSLAVQLSGLSGVPPHELVFVDIHGHRVFSYLNPKTPVRELQEDSPLVAFSVYGEPLAKAPVVVVEAGGGPPPPPGAPGPPPPPGGPPSAGGTWTIPKQKHLKLGTVNRTAEGKLFGTPTLLSLDQDEVTVAQLYKIVAERVPGSSHCDLCVANVTGTKVVRPLLRGDDSLINFAAKQTLGIEWTHPNKQYKEPEPKCHESYRHFQENGEETITLAQCLDSFLAPSSLGEGNEWKCNTCGPVVAETCQKIVEFPDLLLLQLMRFPRRDWTEKLDIEVLYGKQLELLGNSYLLKGIACHHGKAGKGGHYIAIGQTDDGKWRSANDMVIREIEDVYVQTKDAYCLFYAKIK